MDTIKQLKKENIQLKVTIKELIGLVENDYPFNMWAQSNIDDYIKDVKKEIK